MKYRNTTKPKHGGKKELPYTTTWNGLMLIGLLGLMICCQTCTHRPSTKPVTVLAAAYQHTYQSYDIEFFWTNLYGRDQLTISAEVVNNYFLDFYDLLFYVSSQNKDGEELQSTSQYLTLLEPSESDVLTFNLPICGDEARIVFTYTYEIASIKNDTDGFGCFVQELERAGLDKCNGELRRMVIDFLQMKEINPIVTTSLALSETDHLRTIITLDERTSCKQLNLQPGKEPGTCSFSGPLQKVIDLSQNSMVKSIRLQKEEKK